MISRILLLALSFTKKETLKIFTEFFQQYASISPIVFNALFCKFRLVRLCPFFADPVTYMYVRYLCIFPNILVLTKVSIRPHKVNYMFLVLVRVIFKPVARPAGCVRAPVY